MPENIIFSSLGLSKLNYWFAVFLFFFIIFFLQVEIEIQVESSLYFGSVTQVESSVYFGSVTQVESSLYFGTVIQVDSTLYLGVKPKLREVYFFHEIIFFSKPSEKYTDSRFKFITVFGIT